MGKKIIEKITEVDNEGYEKIKTIEKEVIDEARPPNPYEFMTNDELRAELKRLEDLLQ